MAYLVGRNAERFIETRHRVLGTRNGTVKNRQPQIPQIPQIPRIPLDPTQSPLSSFDEEETDESDDELFLAQYTQTNARRAWNRNPKQPAAVSRSRTLEPPVTPGAHGPARLSPSDNRTRVTFQDSSRPAQIRAKAEASFDFPHSLTYADTDTPNEPLPRVPAPGFPFPGSCSEAAGVGGEESPGSHRQRMLGATEDAIGERKTGGELAPFHPLQGCRESGGFAEGELFEEEEEDNDEWEESGIDANFPVRQGHHIGVGAGIASRPATAGTGGTPTVEHLPTGSNYMRARTFQGRHEQLPVVAYQRSQTTALWASRGPTQKPISGAPGTVTAAARGYLQGSRSDSPQGLTAVVGTRIMRQQEGVRPDSPNLMRRSVGQQGGLPRSSSFADQSHMLGPRQVASAFTRDGLPGAASFSPENRPLVQKSNTQRLSTGNRCCGGIVSIPRSYTVDARVGEGIPKESRLIHCDPKSVSARYTSTVTRVVEELSPVRCMSPGSYALKHGVGDVVEKHGVHGSPSQGRTSYSRQMAQAAAAARERRIV